MNEDQIVITFFVVFTVMVWGPGILIRQWQKWRTPKVVEAPPTPLDILVDMVCAEIFKQVPAETFRLKHLLSQEMKELAKAFDIPRTDGISHLSLELTDKQIVLHWFLRTTSWESECHGFLIMDAEPIKLTVAQWERTRKAYQTAYTLLDQRKAAEAERQRQLAACDAIERIFGNARDSETDKPRNNIST